jgi:hypothetical protein
MTDTSFWPDAPLLFQVGLVFLFLVIAWLFVLAIVGDEDEEEQPTPFPRYDHGGDPLLKDHAATSLVIRSSARGETKR